MVRKLITAACILALALALTACGGEKASTAANRSMGTNAASQQWEFERQGKQAKKPQGNGAYHADENGHVDGFHHRSAEAKGKQAGEDLKNTVKDAAEDVGDIGREIGDAAKDAVEDTGEAAKDVGDAARRAGQSVGDGVEDALDGRDARLNNR